MTWEKKDEKGSVSYPYKSHDLWFITESLRWGFMKPETLGGSKTLPEAFAYAKKLIDKVNREDIWKQAAQEAISQGAKFTVADIPASTSRGVETFFDGISFDPENPTAYLQSLKIKKIVL
jgi:bicarbonate transport system substrate-binding protein